MNSDGIVTSASSSKTQCPSGCCKATSDSLARVIASSRRVASTRRRSIATSLVLISFMEERGVVLVEFPGLMRADLGHSRELGERLKPAIGCEAGRSKAGANSAFDRRRQARIDIIAGK